MKVYVVMGNYYPDSVVSSKKAANKIIKKRKKEESYAIEWLWYEFKLDDPSYRGKSI